MLLSSRRVHSPFRNGQFHGNHRESGPTVYRSSFINFSTLRHHRKMAEDPVHRKDCRYLQREYLASKMWEFRSKAEVGQQGLARKGHSGHIVGSLNRERVGKNFPPPSRDQLG